MLLTTVAFRTSDSSVRRVQYLKVTRLRSDYERKIYRARVNPVSICLPSFSSYQLFKTAANYFVNDLR